MIWGQEEIRQLRELWADVTITTTEIGRRLGITKDAAIGKAHRLKLPARKTYPVLIEFEYLVPEIDPDDVVVEDTIPNIVPFPERRPELRSEPGKAVCRWPVGGIMSDTFRVCGKDVVSGSLYCPEHIARANQRV